MFQTFKDVNVAEGLPAIRLWLKTSFLTQFSTLRVVLCFEGDWDILTAETAFSPLIFATTYTTQMWWIHCRWAGMCFLEELSFTSISRYGGAWKPSFSFLFFDLSSECQTSVLNFCSLKEQFRTHLLAENNSTFVLNEKRCLLRQFYI